MTQRTTNIIHLPSSQGSPTPESSAGQCGGEKTGHSSNDDRPLFQRIADALASPRFLLFYLGFYAGCMATVGLAILWSQVLS